jgi:hypothetical protein
MFMGYAFLQSAIYAAPLLTPYVPPGNYPATEPAFLLVGTAISAGTIFIPATARTGRIGSSKHRFSQQGYSFSEILFQHFGFLLFWFQ